MVTAAVLAGLAILLFVGNWRSTLIVTLNGLVHFMGQNRTFRPRHLRRPLTPQLN
jgi:hypothetical protein